MASFIVIVPFNSGFFFFNILFLFSLFETKSHYVAVAGLKFAVSWLQIYREL